MIREKFRTKLLIFFAILYIIHLLKCVFGKNRNIYKDKYTKNINDGIIKERKGELIMKIEGGKYSALYLAKYIIDKCAKDEYPISNLQLQKILYNLQKKLLKKETVLINDDFQAWAYGPVVPEVYFEFCSYGSMCIDEKYDVKIENQIKNIIDPIIENLRKDEPWELVKQTHFKGGAWDTVYKNGSGNKSVIPLELIKDKG